MKPVRSAPVKMARKAPTGISGFDEITSGGLPHGRTSLLMGGPGSGKTIFPLQFFLHGAEHCKEPGIFVAFEETSSRIVANAESFGWNFAKLPPRKLFLLNAQPMPDMVQSGDFDLRGMLAPLGAKIEVAVARRPGRYAKNGLLRMDSARTLTGSAETYLVRTIAIAKEQRAGCVVIDPLSTWSKSSGGISAHSVVERLIDWSKAEGITMVCTSLIDEMADRTESRASLQISTLTDTWIYLDYLVQAGERNRGLSIIKFRGTAHSNQVRELILSNAGVTLTDTYSAGGEVLMGTLRWEKESAKRVANEVAEAAEKLKRVKLDAEEAELEARVKSLQTELMATQVEKALLSHTAKSYEREVTRGRTQMRELRGADAPNSATATNNLHAFGETYLPGRHEIEIVDVYKEPKRALTEVIFMTPTRIKLAASPMRKIVGRLIDTQIALRALGLKDLGP